MIKDLIFRTLVTIIFYFASNYHTYLIGISQDNPPLKDCGHELLPNLSHYPYIRDIVLPFFVLPFILAFINKKNVMPCFFEFWHYFLIIITLKAITIFFTYIPPSNTYCHLTRQLNHCYHQIFSGHNSFAFLSFLLYLKHDIVSFLYIFLVICYSILILMTRCHYSVDIIVSYIIVYLLVD